MTSSDTESSIEGSPAEAGIPLAPPVETRPAAILRGSARGLELVVRARATVEMIALALIARLEEAPTFFRGNDVRVRVEDGPLPAGCLSRLDEIATRFELRIVEVGATRATTADDGAVSRPNLAAGSASAPAVAPELEVAPPVEVVIEPSAPFSVSVTAPVIAAEPEPEPEPAIDGARVVVGPVRSGVILDHPGHLVVVGDVNPGAEIRAEGNIVVLGRLRGTAHAGIGRDVGFILALRLEPQQLRICKTVARACDSDTPSAQPELAHLTGTTIIVEPYQGRLPRSLAASI